MIIRPVIPADAEGIARVLQQLVEAKKRSKPSDVEFVRRHYIDHPDGIQCFVAEDESGEILGFQSLKMAKAGNKYGAPTGWAIIGTHISPKAARRGVGTQLFKATIDAARDAKVPAIEAFIGAKNAEGQAYYEAIGFRTYRLADGAVCKSFKVQ